MRIIGVRHDPDRSIPDTWESWWTTERVGRTYARIAKAALAEGWGLETIVVQDDIRGDFYQPVESTVFVGRTADHVCPQAFATDRWDQLFEVWQHQPLTLCPGFAKVTASWR